MDELEVTLVSVPRQLDDFVQGYAATISVCDGDAQRQVQLMASASDFRVLGVRRRETDPALWVQIANLAHGFIAGSYDTIEQVPSEIRVAAVLDHKGVSRA